MHRVVAVGIVVLSTLAWPASGNNQIIVWEHSEGATFEVSQTPQTVVLTSPGTFKVRATGDYTTGLGDIRSITVAQGVSGTVELYVVAPNGELGAQNVGWVDLSNATTGNIAGLRVQGSIGPDPNDQATRATSATGMFTVTGFIEKELHLQSVPAGGTLGTGAVPLRLHADLYIDDPNATNAGEIHIKAPGDNISVAGAVTGLLHFCSDC